jgi:protein-disulfide isomerase
MASSDSRKNPKQTAREAAQAAKKASEAQQKKRERLITVIGIVVVVVIVGAIVGAVVFANAQSGKVVLPKTVTSPTYGYPVGTSDTSKPFVQLFEDFQCPICAEFEKAGGPAALEAAATAGTLRLNLQPIIFLDQNLNNDSSLRATNAWGCAIEQGAGTKYHSVVFQNQPAKEGTGYTDLQLASFGIQAGLKGDALTTFGKCVPTTTYQKWANAAADYAASKSVNSTPTILVDGKVFNMTADLFTHPAKLVAAILAFAKK